jgi:DNA-binding transcriptional regulator YiaG
MTNHFKIEVPVNLITPDEIQVLRDEFEVDVFVYAHTITVTGVKGNTLAEAAKELLLKRINNQTLTTFN